VTFPRFLFAGEVMDHLDEQDEDAFALPAALYRRARGLPGILLDQLTHHAKRRDTKYSRYPAGASWSCSSPQGMKPGV
jgi:hypothetical protein